LPFNSATTTNLSRWISIAIIGWQMCRPACAITGSFSSHLLHQVLDGIEQLVSATELFAWLVQ
jgi:hypothetical protein